MIETTLFQDISFSVTDLVTFAGWAFAAGVMYMSMKQIKENQEDHKKTVEKELKALEAGTDKQIHAHRVSTSERLDAMNERQTQLEERHISAVEKLGDAMAELAREVRGGLNHQGNRITALESR